MWCPGYQVAINMLQHVSEWSKSSGRMDEIVNEVRYTDQEDHSLAGYVVRAA
jgi:hypothetical protein